MEPRILVLLALASAAIAGPIKVQETNDCATQCSPSTKLNYAPGNTYVYDYRVEYSTSMAGASEDTAKMTLKTTVELEVLSPCDMALSLRDTRLFHTDAMGGLKAADREETFSRSLESNSLRFSFQDGAIEHICTATREEPWVMNIKKGILTAFQNTMDDYSKDQNVTETDVAGTCQTEYKTVSNGYYSNTLRKTKDILTCTDRHDYRTFFQMVPYNEPSELQSIPLMKTTHECDQVIQKGGVLQSTTCTEMHIYRPFSNDQSGGATSVKQILKFNTYKGRVYSRKDTISSRDSLLFDLSAKRPNAQEARHLAEQKLKEICESTAYDVRPESPRLFSDLVFAMKSLDKPTMEEMFRQLKTKTICPGNDKAYKTFLDALPVIRSSSAVSLMTSLITNEDVNQLQAAAWIPSLAFMKAPTSEMLIEAKPLIDNEKFRGYSLLPVSAMVNNFCSGSSACDQSYAVLSIMASLERSIPQGCDASGKDFHQILLTLRAIGNAGHATRAVPVITKCLTNSYNPLEIRVAAANAFRRMPCDAESTELWKTYEDSDLDSELRITAYLAMMRCPSEATLGKMAASLAGDLDEQVGAFVYSHMTNLRQTSDPHKQMVARAMDNLLIPSKYESNPMKASANLEVSALINKINTGFVAESNLIWSNNAQVPRSASANLTVELFGQSINLVDFGGRVEGLEHLIKNMFGHKGASIGKKSDYRGSFYGRIFGNEMFFMHSDNIKLPTEKPSKSWLETLITLAENHDLAYTFSEQLMDVSMIVPSVGGFPINIDVNGSAVVDLVLKGKADLRKLASAPRSMDVDGEIRPSAALEITGTMSVEAHVTQVGLRMRNTLHTSTSVKGRVQMDRGELITVELDNPRDKIKIFDAKSRFFILHDNVEQEQKMITENRKEFELCSSNKLAEITGAKLCGQISFPNASMQSEGPYFPLTGPSSASLTLLKTDTHSGYKLLIKRKANKKSSVAQISFNTPGSRVNRVILMDMSLDYQRKSVGAQVVTPWKKADFNGDVINRDDMKSVSGSLTIDSSDIYGVIAEVGISKSRKQIYLSPRVEIRRPGAEKLQLGGSISKKGLQSLDVDLSLSGLQEKQYHLNTSLTNKNEEKGIKVSVSVDGGKSLYSFEAGHSLKIGKKRTVTVNTKNSLVIATPKKTLAQVEVSGDYKESKSLTLDTTLDIHRLMKKAASFKVKMTRTEKKRRGTVYAVNTNIRSSPFTCSVASTISSKKNGLTSVKTTVDYKIAKLGKDKVILTGKFRDRSTRAYTKYTMDSNVDMKKNPQYNMAVTLDLDHKRKHSEAELVIKYGSNPKDKSKRIFLTTVLNRKSFSLKKASIDYRIQADAPELDVKYVLSGKHEHESDKIDSNIALRYGDDKEVRTAVQLENKSKRRDHIKGNAVIAWPGAEYVLISGLKEEDKKQYAIDMALKSNNEDVLKLTSKAKVSKNPNGAVTLEVFHPERRMILNLNGGKNKNQYEGGIEASWDADRDENKKIAISGSTYNKNSRSTVSLGGDLSFTSPFENFENIAGTFKYGGDKNQHDILGKLNLGNKKNYMTNIILKKPFGLEFLDVSVEAKTPFKQLRKASAQISHKWEGEINTVVKGTLNKEDARIEVRGSGNFEKLNGMASLTSTIKNAEDISVSVTHTLNPENINSLIEVSHNAQPYSAKLNGNFEKKGWHIKTDGDLTLKSPKSEMTTTWEHTSNRRKLNSKLNSKWDKDHLDIELKGSHDNSPVTKFITELKLDSSRKPVRDVAISFTHKLGDDILKTKAELTKRGKTKALSEIKITKSKENTGLDFTLVSPYHEDINGKFDTKLDTYPMKASGELQWHPRKKFTAETTLNAEQWDDASLDIVLATPARNYRNINFRASNKKEGTEMVSHANLDYGSRKNIDLETRYSLDDMNKMARLRLSTPFKHVRSLDTGLRFDGKATDFDSSADFEMVPLVGKFQGAAKLSYGDDMTGTLRLDTPFPEYPYFELSASNLDKGTVRKSRVEASLHPNQVYSADATYSFDLPISIEANVNSPYPEYDNLGLVFQHNHSPSSVASHAELRYQPEKKIEGDLNADWSSNIDGSMVVKTPFSGFEENKLTLRHRGDLDDFSSHGEIDVAEKRVVADVNFKGGKKTTGDFTLSSPIPGMEKLKVEVSKKGKVRNFNGELAVTVNGDKTEVNYGHTLKKKLLKTSFKLKSPYSETVKFSVEHNIKAGKSFSNEASGSYGRKYFINTDISFDCNHPNVQGLGTVNYKLGGRKNEARLSFNKNGEISDMTFSSNGAFNNDEIKIFGSWKNLDGLEANVVLNTPFDNFKTTGLTLSHYGPLDSFKSSGSVTYMDDKTINGMIDLAVDVPALIRLDSSIDTPFEIFPSARITFNHNYDDYRMTINGDASLTTPVADFGYGSLTYGKTGSLDDLMITTRAKQNGKEAAELTLTHRATNQEVFSNFEFESTIYTPLTLSFDLASEPKSFTTKASGNLDSDKFYGEISKTGPIEDTTVVAKAGFNDDAVTVTGLWNTQRGYDGSLEITTPFEGYETTKLEANGAMDEDYKDMNGRLSLSTTVKNFGTGDISLRKTGGLDELVVVGSMLKNNLELTNIRVTNSHTENELHTAVYTRGTLVPEAEAYLDHSGNMNSFETKVKSNVNGVEIIDSMLNFDQDDATVNANAQIKYDIDVLGSNTASLNIEKEGQLDDIRVKIVGNHADKEVTIEGNVDLKKDISGSLAVQTPFEGFNNVGMSFTHSSESDRVKSEGRVNFVDGEEYSGEVELSRNERLGYVKAVVELRTPVEGAEFTKMEYTHNVKENDLTVYTFVEYGKSKKIVCDLSVSVSPKVDFRVDLKTPFENCKDLTASAIIETEWPKLSITSEVDAGEGRRVTLRGSLDATKDISGDITLSTPLKDYSNIGLSFEHSGKLKNFQSNGRVTYKDGKEISGDVTFKFRKPHISVELKTPFSGHKNLKFELSQKKTSKDTTMTTYLKFGRGSVYETETTITSIPRPGFAMTIKTPMEDYRKLEGSFSYDNSWPKLELSSRASAGKDSEFTMDVAFDASDDVSGSVEVKTPIQDFENVGLSFSHIKTTDKMTSEGKIIYMNNKNINGRVEIEKSEWRGLVATAELNTPFENAEKTKLEITFDDASPSYSAGYSFTYGDNKVYSANGKLNAYSVDNVDGSLEVVLPIEGIEYTKAAYEHRYETSRADGSISLTYGDGKIISGELKSTKVPYYDGTITIKTPFEGYESMQGTATFENGDKEYSTSTLLNLGTEQIFSMSSELNMATEPFRASTKISTPFDDFRNMELILTHEGGINEFHCTGFLTTPFTDTITAATNVKYNTLFDVDASASIKSSFEGMDDLLAEISNSEHGDEKKVHAVVGWTSRKQIVVDGMVSRTDSWYVKKLNGDWSLTTPFDALSKLAIQAEHKDEQEKYGQSVVLELNGEKLLDLDTEYSSKDKHEGSVTLRKPLPMQYTMSASSNAGVTEAEVVANWNRDETDSNVRITASINDQLDNQKGDHSVDIGVEHASRKVGIVHQLSSSDPSTKSSGKIYWDNDDSSNVYYELEIKDTSRSYTEVTEGSLSLGAFSQTIGFTGSYSDNKVQQTGDIVFSWDKERSDKQIGLAGTITRGDTVKGDVTLRMPAIRKEIHIDSEITLKSGRIILDTKTDISYSKDSRKTLTLTSKVEDISDYYSHFNYSLAVGVSHPYTNVDIQMTSHLGYSDEKVTVGLNTDYMTARRQNKNLGLLAEINSLKKQLSLQIDTPMSKTEYFAEQISETPCKFSVISKVDNVEALRSDFMLDKEQRLVEINVAEGSDGIKLSAGYSSPTEFHTQISRTGNSLEETEALLAVRLNNTRLLHTRLHWDPEMIQTMLRAVRERIASDSAQEVETWLEIRAALSEEITGKYKDITSALDEDLRPLVQELEQEFEYISRQMNKLSRAMQSAYRNNDYYIQELGSLTETYQKIQERLSHFKHEFRQETKNIIKSLNKGLDKMVAYPIQERYDEMVNKGITILNNEIHKVLLVLETLLARIDNSLTSYRNRMLQAQEKTTGAIYNNTYMASISGALNSVDVRPYIPSWRVPEEYTSTMSSAARHVGSKVGYVLEAPGLYHVKRGVNEVYQQGLWAYNYWQVERNVYRHSQNILDLIEEIIIDELSQYADEIERLYHPITVWDPEHGEIQAEFRLPVDVHRLDELPDMSPLAKQVTVYLPDQSTVDTISKYMPDVWPNTDGNEIREQLEKYQPTKSFRGRRHRKKHNRRH